MFVAARYVAKFDVADMDGEDRARCIDTLDQLAKAQAIDWQVVRRITDGDEAKLCRLRRPQCNGLLHLSGNNA